MDENTKFMQKYLLSDERDLFFDGFVEEELREDIGFTLVDKAIKILHETFEDDYQTVPDTLEHREHALNYMSAVLSFCRNQKPQIGWIEYN
tara:strand:+ start:411 stop:683 length:273 start_codon:yes stop_codon:yes gene_type:complete